jgi:alpha-N-arabinofuranosidase
MLLVTPEAVLRETVYWALLMQRKYSGNLAIDAWTECDSYETDDGRGRRIAVPYLDVSATLDDRTGRQFVSIVNRHRNDACEIELKTGKSGSAKTYSLTHADPLAMNTFDAPETVVPVGADLDGGNGTLKLTVPAHSYVIVEV